MGDDDHCHMLLRQLADDLEDLSGQLRIQCRRRLVKKQNVRIHAQCSRDRDTLLLATGKLLRIVVFLALEAHLSNECHGFLHDFRLVSLLHMDRSVTEVLEHVVVRKQVELLEYKAKIALDLAKLSI